MKSSFAARIRSLAVLARLSVALGAVAAGSAGCAVDAADEPASAASAEIAARPGGEQLIAALSDAELVERVRAFRARNPGDWRGIVVVQGRPFGVNPLSGAVSWADRTLEPAGPSVELTATEAEAAARRFVEANADLLEMTPAESRALKVRDAEFSCCGADSPWTLQFFGRFRTPGYEDLRFADKVVAYRVSVGRDGTVRKIIQDDQLARSFSRLAISTTPAIAWGDPRIVDNVVGLPLEYLHGGLLGITPEPVGKDDLVPGAVSLTMFVEPTTEPRGLRVRLAHKLRVTRHEPGTFISGFFQIIVDASTGAVLANEPWTTD
jgi:hypothetical protein